MADRAETGGRLLVRALREHGVDRVFAIPGESYLEILDALHDAPDIKMTIARHEGAAANMAEADGKLTGRPGICFVTRGPGATHAAIGVHTAKQDSTPMILFIGQVPRDERHREGFQEIDYGAFFGPIAKWAAEIDDAARIGEMVGRAFHIACSGRPGPVVLALPEDMLREKALPSPRKPLVARSAPAADDLARLSDLLGKAERPLLLCGGSSWTDQARRDLQDFAERFALPVCASFRRQDLFDNLHANYAGHLGFGVNPELAERVRNCDLLLAVGARIGDIATNGYSLITAPRPKQTLVHIHPGAEELNRVYEADLPICASLPEAMASLANLTPHGIPRWSGEAAKAHDAYLAFTTPAPAAPASGFVDLGAVMAHLQTSLPADAIIANGAGNYAIWVHRFHRYRGARGQLAPVSGAMGYGFPAAIAAKLRHPGRTVVCFAGDGCFMMYPQEFATAMQSGAAVIVILVNNGMYGTIRMHQERAYPGRVSGTDLVNPDFAALARSFGAFAETVTETADFADAFARAQAAQKPALLELRVDPAQITPGARLD